VAGDSWDSRSWMIQRIPIEVAIAFGDHYQW
jgi:hypothetical protein